jgi:hypothetical protein
MARWIKLAMLVVVVGLVRGFWVVCGVCTGEVLCRNVPADSCLVLRVISIFHVMMQPGVFTLALLLLKVERFIPVLHGMVYWCLSCITILILFHWIVAS